MKLSLARTNELCEELWQWSLDNGLLVKKWPEWEENGGMYKAENHCFYCEYGFQRIPKTYSLHTSCDFCPYFRMFGYRCIDVNSPWSQSYVSGPNHVAFLEQVKQVRAGGAKTYRAGKKYMR